MKLLPNVSPYLGHDNRGSFLISKWDFCDGIRSKQLSLELIHWSTIKDYTPHVNYGMERQFRVLWNSLEEEKT